MCTLDCVAEYINNGEGGMTLPLIRDAGGLGRI